MPIPSRHTDPNAFNKFVQGLIDDGVLTHDQIAAEVVKHFTTLVDITPEDAADPKNQQFMANTIKVFEIPRPIHEESWGDRPTHCDRLLDVLDALRDKGIFVDDYCQCCDDCGKPACMEKVRQAAKAANCDGFLVCFREKVQECRGTDILVLNYGASDNDPNQALQVALKIVQALVNAGFEVQQDAGQPNQIRLVEFVWRRRRYTTAS